MGDEKVDAKAILIGIVIGFMVGAVAALVVGIAVSIGSGGSGTGEAIQTSVVVTWAIPTIGIPLIIWPVESRRVSGVHAKRESARQAQAERELVGLETSRRELERRVEDQRNEWIRLVKTLPGRAVDLYGQAVSRLQDAAQDLAQAEQHRTAGAFTPFWESIERGMIHLNVHRSFVENARSCAVEYSKAAESLTTSGGYAEVVPFPTKARDVAVIDAGTVLAGSFAKVVYSARADFGFASIFEQRRTTAAVIAGFRSLSEAVDRMGEVVASSYSQLASALEAASRRGEEAIAKSIAKSTDELRQPAWLMHKDTLGGQIVQMNDALTEIARSTRR